MSVVVFRMQQSETWIGLFKTVFQQAIKCPHLLAGHPEGRGFVALRRHRCALPAADGRRLEPLQVLQRHPAGSHGAGARGAQDRLVQPLRPPPFLRGNGRQLRRHADEPHQNPQHHVQSEATKVLSGWWWCGGGISGGEANRWVLRLAPVSVFLSETQSQRCEWAVIEAFWFPHQHHTRLPSELNLAALRLLRLLQNANQKWNINVLLLWWLCFLAGLKTRGWWGLVGAGGGGLVEEKLFLWLVFATKCCGFCRTVWSPPACCGRIFYTLFIRSTKTTSPGETRTSSTLSSTTTQVQPSSCCCSDHFRLLKRERWMCHSPLFWSKIVFKWFVASWTRIELPVIIDIARIITKCVHSISPKLYVLLSFKKR